MKRNALTLLLVLLSTLSLSAQNWRAGIHDPSTIVKCKDRYWVFGTGDGIHAMYSYDLVTWSNGPSPFTKTDFPAWINNYVKGGTDGRVVIYPSISDKFIEIPNAYTTDSRVILWPNTNHACQRWQLTRQDAPVSLPETSLPEALKISPNPASTHLWIEGAAPDATVIVLTMDGKEVLRQKLQGSISIAHLPAGPYLLKVVDPEGSRLQKFVIQP